MMASPLVYMFLVAVAIIIAVRQQLCLEAALDRVEALRSAVADHAAHTVFETHATVPIRAHDHVLYVRAGVVLPSGAALLVQDTNGVDHGHSA